MDFYKGAVPPLNETERMEAFNNLDLNNAPHNPLTARLAYVLAKLLQVSSSAVPTWFQATPLVLLIDKHNCCNTYLPDSITAQMHAQF